MARITEDTLSVLQDPITHKTTVEWETFIADAEEEWEEFVDRRPLGMVKEQSSGEEAEDDDSFGSTEGNVFEGAYMIPEEFE